MSLSKCVHFVQPTLLFLYFVFIFNFFVFCFQDKEKERKKRMEAEKSKRKPMVDMNAGMYAALQTVPGNLLVPQSAV